MGLEEAGRNRRYERLRETAKRLGACAVATAHHADDQAETVLMNLLRGSGLAGLCGMEEDRPLGDGIRLIRPLLKVSRRELEAFLKEEGQPWQEDETNRDSRFRRNFIRNRLLAACGEISPDPAAAIGRAAEHLKDAQAYLLRQAAAWQSENGVDVSRTDTLPLSFLRQTDPALQYVLWRIFLEAHGGLKDVGERHFDALKALAEQESGSRLMLPGGRTILREQESIRLLSDLGEKKETWSFRIRLFPWKEGLKIPAGTYTKWIDYDIIKNPLCLRTRQEGDYLILPDGSRKSLARFMIDEKIPLGKRDTVPLLADGSHVLWVIGYRLSAAAYIGSGTRTAAEIQVKKIGEAYERA